MVLFSLLMATRPEIIGMGNLSFSDELPEAATP